MACAVSIRIVVDLPAPFGPSSPKQIPAGTSRSMPSTAVSEPKDLRTPRRERAGPATPSHGIATDRGSASPRAYGRPRWHPRIVPADLDTVRRLALALPETTEEDHHGRPSFRLRGKIFATLPVPHERAMLKLPRDEQRAISAAQPDVYAPVPGTWGERGSTLVELPGADEAELAELVEEDWGRLPPKRRRRPRDGEGGG